MKKFLTSLLFFVLLAFSVNSEEAEKYKINFTDLPLEQYIQFVSKTCNVNFLFDKKDLQVEGTPLTVSITSDVDISKKNIMATLLQVLQINGFFVLEENDNLIIHKNPNAPHLSKIVMKDDLQKEPPIITKIFFLKNLNPESLSSILPPMLSKTALFEILERYVIITDITKNIEKIQDLLKIIDSAKNPLQIERYQAKTRAPEYLSALIQKIIQPFLQKNPFIVVSQEETSSLFLISTPFLIEKAISILSSLEETPKNLQKFINPDNVFLYHIQNISKKDFKVALKNLIKSFKEEGYQDTSLVDILKRAKWVQGTNSFIFMGTPQEINKLKEILSSIDIPSNEDLKLLGAASEKALEKLGIPSQDVLKELGISPKEALKLLDQNSFYIYKIQNTSKEKILSALKDTVKSLKKADIPEKPLIEAIESAKYIKENNSILFIGKPTALKQIETLISSFDLDLSKHKILPSSSQFFLYSPKNKSLDSIVNSLHEIADSLQSADLVNPSFMQTIENMKKVTKTNSLLFTGDTQSILRIQELLKKIDVSFSGEQKTYFLYKLKNTSGNIIEEDLDRFSEKLKEQDIKNPELLHVIENAKWIPETNSIMLTGNAQAIQEAKLIIAEYDVSRKEQPLNHDNFLIYKPKHASLSYIKNSLKETADNLQKAHLADPSLLNTIKSMKIIESTNSLAFTGTDKSLEKLSNLLSTIDVEEAKRAKIEKIGEKTYLIYKIKNADPQTLINSILSISSDLQKTSGEKQFIKTLSSVKYQKDTNSLLFTGTLDSLKKTQALVEKFDTPTLPLKGPLSYFIYKPKYLKGPTLKTILKDFADHLKGTGIQNQTLSRSIDNMKWDPKTNSLILSADPTTLEELKNLLTTFDVPQQEAPIQDILQPMDDVSFLVYKLQYHKGDEIQTALRQIAKELSTADVKISSPLIKAINSIQWIQITNSLLCSGDAQTMAKLKELIKNIDFPLKQVFIEVVVIETTFSNLFQFGLDWGGKFKYKNRFVTGTSNTSPITNANGTQSLNPFMQNLDNLSTSVTNPTTLPFSTGFDLGIIGDILLHKGKSFLSLGSFLEAIETDEESSIITTPKLIAQDNKTSTIFFGQNIPYIGSQTSIINPGQTTTTNLEYRDVGMSLSLTPVLGNSDAVTLDINLQRTVALTQTEFATTESTDVQGITTSKTSMQTTVHIPNKNFLVLSGMVTENKDKTKTGIPCLGGLPLIGAAFSKNSKNINKKNIVIFIRPHIINSHQDMESITQSQEDFFRDSSGSPNLEKDFDEGIEFLKTYEDE